MEGMDGVVESRVKVANQGRVGTCEFFIRLLAFAFTLVATILLGVDKQTKVVPVQVTPNLPPLIVAVAAKWHYLSAFVYFVVANAIACSYAILSLILSNVTKTNNGHKSTHGLVIIILDIVMVAMLFSGNGAAMAVGLIGYKGNSHVQWKEVCDVFGKFCNQAVASITLSLLGATVFLLLVALAALRLHKKTK